MDLVAGAIDRRQSKEREALAVEPRHHAPSGDSPTRILIDSRRIVFSFLLSPSNYLSRKAIMSANTGEPQFFHYPEVRQGPSAPYQNEDQSIPVFRGTPLAIGAAL